MKRILLAIGCCFVAWNHAQAVDDPLASPQAKRPWLRNGLIADMDELEKYVNGTFGPNDYSQVEAINNRDASPRFKIRDDADVALLADYYHATRARGEVDIMESQRVDKKGEPIPPTNKEVEIAKADRAKIGELGGKIANSKSAPVKLLGELIYASLPGYCYLKAQWLPNVYFKQDQAGGLYYVGPAAGEVKEPTILSGAYTILINPNTSPRWHDLYRRSQFGGPAASTTGLAARAGTGRGAAPAIAGGGLVPSNPRAIGPIPPAQRMPIVPPQIQRQPAPQAPIARGTGPGGNGIGNGINGPGR